MDESSRRTSDTGVPTPPTMANDVEKATEAAKASSSPSSVPGNEAEENYKPKTLKFWTIIICIFLGLFLVALDRTIVGTAVPQITEDFNSLGDIGWYGSAYQLTTAASQLVFGRVYRFYDCKRIFLSCVLVFEIGSAICGAAPSSTVFIIGRAIAGLGGAGIFTGVQIIMMSIVPLRKRASFQGVFGMVFGGASVMGPLVGGAFTDGISWRWCFYINLPIGAVAVLCLIFILHIPKKQQKPATVWEHFVRLDPLGTFFFVPSIVSLLIALQWGGSTYAWDSWRIILLLVLFGVLFFAFAAVQVFLPKTATVPVRIISQRSILAGAIFMFAIAGSMLMAIYFLPLWFQVVQGVTAVQSGINTLPFVLSLVVASIMSGIFTNKIGYYVPAMLVSPSLMAVGQGLMSTFRVGEASSHWIAFQFLAGFGLGIGMQASTLAAQAVLPLPDIPTGVAIMFFSQQLGGGIFTSVGQNLLSTYMVSHAADIPGVDSAQITSEGATDLVNDVPPDAQLAVKEVYNQAISKIFLCAMGVALAAVIAALFMEWKNVKKTGPPTGTPGAGAPGAKLAGETKESGTPPPPPDGPSPTSDPPRDEPNPSTSGSSSFESSKPEAVSCSRNDSPRQSEDKTTPTPAKKSGCEHCEHCQLSRAVTLAPSSEQASRASPQSLTQKSTGTHRGVGPEPRAAEEATRLASIARNAVAQLEELMKPNSVIGVVQGDQHASREPARQSSERKSDEEGRRPSMSVPPPPARDRRRGSFNRRPTTQDLMQNAQRVSARLDMEERVSRESVRQPQQPSLSKLSVEKPTSLEEE